MSLQSRTPLATGTACKQPWLAVRRFRRQVSPFQGCGSLMGVPLWGTVATPGEVGSWHIRVSLPGMEATARDLQCRAPLGVPMRHAAAKIRSIFHR